jgi:membrane associated rhomboid family serine protease
MLLKYPKVKISAVKSLIAANVLIYIGQTVTPPAYERLFELWPLEPIGTERYFHPWQLLTYSFLHSTGGVRMLPHLLVNMTGLWVFGSPVERVVGPTRLLICYFAAVIVAALSHLLLPPLFGLPPHPIIGASGGVFGLLLVYACLFPKADPLNLPFPAPAWLLAAVFGGVELVTALTRTVLGDPHFAHLGGMLGGFLVLMQWRFTRSRS